MTYVSCASAGIYRDGGWYDDPALLEELRGATTVPGMEVLAEIYPPYEQERVPPALFGVDQQGLEQIRNVAHATRTDFRRGPASVLVRLGDACVSRSVIYLLDQDNTRTLYETHRPNDRAVSPARNRSEIRYVDQYRRADPFVAYLWIGSGGCVNYDHWLIDDLPRLRALTELRRLRPYARIVVVSPDCGPRHNAVHAESAGAVAASLGIDNVELITVDREARIFFQELYFVTPVSSHPVLKSPEAMDFVADSVLAAIEDQDATADDALPKRLFVERRWTGQRDLVNQAEIAAMLAEQGFRSIDTEQMPVLLQARLFAAADMVIGCMGAAMANAVFCQPRARIGHIAPQGWIETFYWDLASARRQSYAACYGLSTPQPGPAWQKNFRVNPADVAQMLDHLCAGDTVPAEPAPAARDWFAFPAQPEDSGMAVASAPPPHDPFSLPAQPQPDPDTHTPPAAPYDPFGFPAYDKPAQPPRPRDPFSF
jgi:hypothetical protein